MKIWSVFNITPDSFYSNSRYNNSNFIDVAKETLKQGADVLDIGAESSRPFSDRVDAITEWKRLEKPLSLLKDELSDNDFSTKISIDTYKPEIAEKVLKLGVGIINDIWNVFQIPY